MRRAAKVDENQAEIVRALRELGCSVQSLAAIGQGCPDLLVGRWGRNVLMEIKDGSKSPSRRKLTPAESDWISDWRGEVHVVETVDEARKLMGLWIEGEKC